MMEQKEKLTFTKSIMSIVMFLYFVGVIIGTFLLIFAAYNDYKMGVAIDSSMFITYATYLCTPTATAIGFYAWKSKAENLLKIQQSYESQKTSDDNLFIQTLAQMGGNN